MKQTTVPGIEAVPSSRSSVGDGDMWLIVPGLGGSGPHHWQTLWEADRTGACRFRPRSWDAPSRADWVAALDTAVAGLCQPVLLIAHSLGCLTVAEWASTAARASVGKVVAALLVAPPDVTRPDIDPRVRGFAPPPATPLPFPSLLVASADDPYCALGKARALAERWGSAFHDAGAQGHLNADSGLGDWPAGRALLAALLRRGPLRGDRP